jgi:SAM-dependent MidA family methyltransferase
MTPERLDRFMARANAAYYATRDPFADFTTAPEISQVFGELLGLWAAVAWRQMGAPAAVLLAEAGPGRGTLMADALRAIRAVAPDFAAALSVRLVETSPRLRAAQAARLPDAVWHDRVEDLPDGPLILLANEFLDALPIRQFVRRGAAWTERHVAHGRFVEHPADPAPAEEAPEGTVREVCEPALALAAHLGARYAASPGAALFLDYGPRASQPGDSLQALRDGRPADPLGDPGAADLTAHVDFAALAAAARRAGAAAFGPVPQGAFLMRLGLYPRANRLARGRSPAEALELMEGARRLAEPDRMGRLFKALALCHPGGPTPPGFETA